MLGGIGVHVCEYCGRVFDTIGDYFNCQESHQDAPGYDQWLQRVLAEQER